MQGVGLTAGALLLGLAMAPAQAAPGAALPDGVRAGGDIVLVEGGCGGQFYRGPYGRCYPKPYYIGPPYGPPVYYYAKPGAPRCVTRATPYGYKKVCRY
jgi:hypothetical protein